MDGKRKNDAINPEERGGLPTPLIIGGGVAALLVVLVVVGFIIVAVESAAVEEAYGEQIAGLCRDLPMGEPDLANLPGAATDGTTQLLLLRTGTGQRHAWHSQLPVGWRAETGDEVGLVGCVLADTEEIEVCEYARVGPDQDTYSVRIERFQTTTTVNLLNPTTGERVAERTVTGGEPDPCPPDSPDLDVTQRLEGSEPTTDDFQDWFESFVN